MMSLINIVDLFILIYINFIYYANIFKILYLINY